MEASGEASSDRLVSYAFYCDSGRHTKAADSSVQSDDANLQQGLASVVGVTKMKLASHYFSLVDFVSPPCRDICAKFRAVFQFRVGVL